ncbi:MAG: hypothetical protein V1725_01885 [archaeon]
MTKDQYHKEIDAVQEILAQIEKPLKEKHASDDDVYNALTQKLTELNREKLTPEKRRAVHAVMGDVELSRFHFTNAESQYRLAKDPVRLGGVALFYERSSKPELADSLYAEIMRMNPPVIIHESRDATFFSALANRYEQKGNTKKAAEINKKLQTYRASPTKG